MENHASNPPRHTLQKTAKKIKPVNLTYTIEQMEGDFIHIISNIDKGLINNVKVADLSGAIASKNAAAARKAAGVDKIPVAYKPLDTGVESGLLKGGAAGAKDIVKAGLTPIELSMTNPLALEYAKKHSAKLIVEVSGQTKKAVNKIIQDSLVSNRHPMNSAKLIRDVVGLTERDAVAVANRYDRLWMQGVEQMGFSSNQATKRAEAMSRTYADKLHRSRTKTIARTETHNAINEGRKLVWQINEEEGVLEGYVRQWVTASDERVREEHNDMNGQTIPLNGTWQLPNGDEQTFPGEGDVNCRCTEILVEGKAPKKPKVKPEAKPAIEIAPAKPKPRPKQPKKPKAPKKLSNATKLTADEKKLIHDWTDLKYTDIRRAQKGEAAWIKKYGKITPDYHKRLKEGRKLVESLDKIKPFKGEVFRGMSFSKKEFNQFQKAFINKQNPVMTMKTLDSYTKDVRVGKKFYQNSLAYKDKTPVLLQVKNKAGVDIAKLSMFDNEQEVLMPSMAKIRIIEIKKEGAYNIFIGEQI